MGMKNRMRGGACILQYKSPTISERPFSAEHLRVTSKVLWKMVYLLEKRTHNVVASLCNFESTAVRGTRLVYATGATRQGNSMSRRRRIVIAEDHTILREGLRALLASDPEFDVVGDVEDGLEAIKSVKNLSPDVVIIDLSMPKMNGVGAIKEIKRVAPDTKIVVLTVHTHLRQCPIFEHWLIACNY